MLRKAEMPGSEEGLWPAPLSAAWPCRLRKLLCPAGSGDRLAVSSQAGLRPRAGGLLAGGRENLKTPQPRQ